LRKEKKNGKKEVNEMRFSQSQHSNRCGGEFPGFLSRFDKGLGKS
jgi:hypothetical protein